MLTQAFILSFTITAVYIIFQEGMLLGFIREWAEKYIDKFFIWLAKITKQSDYEFAGKIWSKHWQKPIFSCVICMSGIWTILITWSFNFQLIFIVCGINVLIDKVINYEGNA